MAGNTVRLLRHSGMAGGREPLGLPVPGQKLLEVLGLGSARDYALEHVGQPGQKLDPVKQCTVSKTPVCEGFP